MSSSTKYAGAVTQSGVVAGQATWSTTSNVLGAPDTAATAASLSGSGDSITRELRVSSFGFSSSDFPTTATITGIEVAILAYRTGDGSYPSSVYLQLASGSAGSENKGTGISIGSSYSWHSFGGDGDLWGETLTATDLHDSDFGFRFRLEVAVLPLPETSVPIVDSARMTVYFVNGWSAAMPIGEDDAMPIVLADQWYNCKVT